GLSGGDGRRSRERAVLLRKSPAGAACRRAHWGGDAQRSRGASTGWCSRDQRVTSGSVHGRSRRPAPQSGPATAQTSRAQTRDESGARSYIAAAVTGRRSATTAVVSRADVAQPTSLL